uniref:DUF433 domain-containing protein n=1 Tax=Geoglobus ahangari TaxID=113653 RepID=A0A7C4S4X6_9EURY
MFMIIKEKGYARIKGSRVRVVDIVRKYYILRYSKREIAEQYGLTIEEVNEALWYYITHKREILEHLKKEEEITLELLRHRSREYIR